MPDLPGLLGDLSDEHASLDELVATLSPDAWEQPTPAEPWTVRDQIAHLAFFDDQAVLALTAPERFRAAAASVGADPSAFMESSVERGRTMPARAVLAWWREARAALLDAARAADPAARVPWFGTDMSLASFVTARLMETWAHGEDVADALGRSRPPTNRLRHVAHLGVATRAHSYRVNGLPVPAEPVRVELTAPDGSLWVWGEEDAPQAVRGPALDFCLVVVQRRHVDDTALEITGDQARRWMTIAQAFAGPPGPGRRPSGG